MPVLLLSFLTAFTLTYFAIPSIITIATEKRLFDEPNERSSHTTKTPSLGGAAIFFGTIFAIILWTPFENFGTLQYVLCSFILIFLIGAKDDIDPVRPRIKIIAQLLAAAILIFKSDIQLSSFYGLFGIYTGLPSWVYIVVTFLTILVIINAFNLIDGINGLAGSLGVLIISTLGIWYFLVDRVELAIIGFSTTGAIIAFLKYNFTPSRIFMGDTGALLIGLVSSILTIQFIDYNDRLPADALYKFQAAPVVAIGILVVPLFDTVRVFVTRIYRGQSPFQPDRRHIHHLLIDYGLDHMQATFALIIANIFFISLVFSLHNRMELHLLLLMLFVISTTITFLLHKAVLQKKAERREFKV